MQENTTHWVLLGLKKYWSQQAKQLDFEAFVHHYVRSMIAQNRETGLAFWQFVRRNQNDTLLEMYKKWRKCRL